MYTRETINELNMLSKEVFGSSSKWKKMVEKGVPELITEDTSRFNEKGEKEVVKTPKMFVGPNGGELYQSSLNRYTVESVKEFMLGVLVKRKSFEESIKKQKEENLAKQEALKNATGSSL